MVQGRNDTCPAAEPDPPIESGSDAGTTIIAIAMKTHKRTAGGGGGGAPPPPPPAGGGGGAPRGAGQKCDHPPNHNGAGRPPQGPP
ncbi:hypothetical protein ABIC61_000001, partial [Curtobacterium sp. 1544]